MHKLNAVRSGLIAITILALAACENGSGLTAPATDLEAVNFEPQYVSSPQIIPVTSVPQARTYPGSKTAGEASVCKDASSPAGTYTFNVSSANVQPGDMVATSVTLLAGQCSIVYNRHSRISTGGPITTITITEAIPGSASYRLDRVVADDDALGSRTGAGPSATLAVNANHGAYANFFNVVTSTHPPQPGASRRSIADRVDQVHGNQVHVMYVLPSDGVDRGLDTTSTLASSVGSFQNWLAGQTGGRRLRLDTYDGAIDITFFRIPRTNSQMMSYGVFIRDTIEKELAIAGFNVATKIYAAYYDGGSTASCASAPLPPSYPGLVAAVYLQGEVPGAPPCNSTPFAASPTDPPQYLEFVMLHELLHTLGFAASNAPNASSPGHVGDDNRDLMYAGPLPWIPSILDVGKNDYFGANVPPGVLNLSNSAFLAP